MMTESLQSVRFTITAVFYLNAVFGMLYLLQSWIVTPHGQSGLPFGVFPSPLSPFVLERKYLPLSSTKNFSPLLKASILHTALYQKLVFFNVLFFPRNLLRSDKTQTKML